jgi:hypothetical protein
MPIEVVYLVAFATSPFWLVLLGAAVVSIFSCNHEWEKVDGGFLMPNKYKCRKCNKTKTVHTKQSREPWRDW